jgi:phosphatidylglycerophosphate synthase
LAHSSVLAVLDATATTPDALSVQRLRTQLTELGVERCVVVSGSASATEVSRLLRDNDNVVLVSGDIALHTRALRTIVRGTASRALVSRRIHESAHDARIDRDRLASAGSAYHSVGAPNSTLLDVVGIAPSDRLALADSLDEWAVRGPAETPVVSVAAVALARSGAPVRAVDIREFGWLRVRDDAAMRAAEAELAAADEEWLAVHSAVKAEDEAFTTFFVSPYSRYIAAWCARHGIRPNWVTLLSIALGGAAAVGFGFGTRAGLVVGAVLLQVSFMLDCVDGQVARLTGTFSAFGAWLDITFDRAKEYAVYAGLAVGAGRAGLGNLWPWALAALVIRVSRHLVDFSFAARAVSDQPIVRDLMEPDDGMATSSRGTVEQTSRRMDASALLRWGRKIAVLPFGQRLALISVTAAVSDARVTFYALVPWAGAAGLYSTTGRVLRSLGR